MHSMRTAKEKATRHMRLPAATPSYRCFLVRCRRDEGEAPADRAAWHFTVEEAGGHSLPRGFACLQAVEAYLERELGGAVAAAES